MAGPNASRTSDALTGLADAGTLADQAQRMFAGHQHAVSVLAFDLDQLKRVNETFGHTTGDRILRIFAEGLARALGPTCLAGRTGGDEFVAVLPGCGIKTALAVADQVRARFADEAYYVDADCVRATVSGGVATNIGCGGRWSNAVFAATRALERAKALGCDRVMPAQADDAV